MRNAAAPSVSDILDKKRTAGRHIPMISTPDCRIKPMAGAGLDAAERRSWAREVYEADLATRYTTLAAAFRSGVALDATLLEGELRLLVEGAAAVDRLFVPPIEGAFLLAQQKVLASTLVVTERTDGKKTGRRAAFVCPA